MNKLLLKLYLIGKIKDEDGSEHKLFPTSISFSTAKILQNLVTNFSATQTLEIGLAYGLSAVSICDIHAQRGHGQHTAIDPAQRNHFKNLGIKNIQKAKLSDYFNFFEEDSHNCLQRLVKDKEAFDFIFVDGLHEYDYMIAEFKLINQLLKKDGILVFDDTYLPEVRKVVNYIMTQSSAYEVLNIWNYTKESRKKRFGFLRKRFFSKGIFSYPKYFLNGFNVIILKKHDCSFETIV